MACGTLWEAELPSTCPALPSTCPALPCLARPTLEAPANGSLRMLSPHTCRPICLYHLPNQPTDLHHLSSSAQPSPSPLPPIMKPPSATRQGSAHSACAAVRPPCCAPATPGGRPRCAGSAQSRTAGPAPSKATGADRRMVRQPGSSARMRMSAAVVPGANSTRGQPCKRKRASVPHSKPGPSTAMLAGGGAMQHGPCHC